MGDLLGGQSQAPIDPTTGQPNPYQPQTGLMGALNNPGVQGLLATYLGAVGSPRSEGLGGAISHGGLAGLQQYSQAQQQQQMLPYMQAELQTKQLQAKQLGMELKPLTKDQAQGFTDWKNQIAAQRDSTDPSVRAMYDPQELAYATLLESQVRGGQITGDQALKAMSAFKESAVMQQMINLQKVQMGGNILSRFAPGAAGTTGQPAGAPPAAAAPASQFKVPAEAQQLKPGVAQMMNVPGLGMTNVKTDDGKTFFAIGGDGKWVPLQP
jgi:hypothetical protein